MLVIIIAGLYSCSQKIIPNSEIKTEKFLATDSVLHISTFFKNNGYCVVDHDFAITFFPLSDVKKLDSLLFSYFEVKKINKNKKIKEVFEKSNIKKFTEDECFSILYKLFSQSVENPKLLTKRNNNYFVVEKGCIRIYWNWGTNYWMLDYIENFNSTAKGIIFCKNFRSNYKWVAVTTTEYKKVKVN